MSVSTKLYISKRYELKDIITVMENHLNLKEQSRRKRNVLGKDYTEKFKIEVKPTTVVGMNHLEFICDDIFRTMVVFDNTDLPIKGMYELHLGHNEQSIAIMRTIAKVLGGLLEEGDCSGNIESIHGMLSENNGLPYFIKWAILNNKISNENDLVGLNEAIHQWHDNLRNSDRSDMELFPRMLKKVKHPTRYPEEEREEKK